MKYLALLLLLTATAWGTVAHLVSITDSSSNRVVGSAGNTTTVTDVEYRLTVDDGSMIYVGSYWPRWKWSYAPTDMTTNSDVEIRIEGKYLFIKKPDGKFLKTRIIRREKKG